MNKPPLPSKVSDLPAYWLTRAHAELSPHFGHGPEVSGWLAQAIIGCASDLQQVLEAEAKGSQEKTP